MKGYQGLIDNEFIPLPSHAVSNIIQRGGTILKTARCMEFKTPEGRRKAFDNLKAAEVDALIVIGGDGTFSGADVFSREFGFPVIGIPGRSEEHTSELQSLMRISYAVFCLKKKIQTRNQLKDSQ